MQQAPVMKSSGLAPINDETVHVFGRNLEERVVESKQEEDSPEKKQEEDDKKREQEDDLESIKKRKFETVTGEEDEETSFQGDFKLFTWDKSSSNWIEKGRGQLKLNDPIDSRQHRSRLIMRAGGTYRIILNVAIQHSFFKVISSTKTSIRFTDSLNVWAASGSNAKQLGDLIEERLSSAAKQASTSSHLQEDKKTEKGSESPDSESESASSKSSETSREGERNGASKNNEYTSDTPTQDQKELSDTSGRDGASNPTRPDDLSKEDSNETLLDTVSPKTNSEHQVKASDEEFEDKHRKEQPDEKNSNEGLKEKTEQSDERHHKEQLKETDDANEPAKRIKLISG